MTRQARGFNLLELMIALVIGLALVAGFILVLQRSRRDLTTSESLAGAQESARHVLSLLASDIEHAGFFGLAAGRVQLVRGGSVLAEDAALLQPTAALPVPAVAGLPAGAHACGVNFAVDLLRVAQASDNSYALGTGATDCAPTGSAGGAAATADTLTLRHASLEVVSPRAGRVQVYSTARASAGPLQLFADGRAPGPVDTDHEVRDLEVRSYYVANNSVGRPGWPALRVKSLTESRGAAQFRDEEVMPGVEDLQVEFLVSGLDEGRAVVRQVAADSASLAAGHTIALRLWLRIRADVTEPGYRDDRTWRYANVVFRPGAAESRHRRLLIERTVALRNPRP